MEELQRDDHSYPEASPEAAVQADGEPESGAATETDDSAPPRDLGPPAPRRRRNDRWNILWREWIRPLLIIAVVMFSFRSAVADWNDVPTGSMKPTILEGDRIFINKVAYDLKFPFTRWRLKTWGDPEWGDIVVLHSPEDGKRLVKRVVGLPGDIVHVIQGELHLNGEKVGYFELDPLIVEDIQAQLGPERQDRRLRSEQVEGREHHVMMGRSTTYGRFNGPFTVPPGQFYVMGDNRSNSRDSRYFGPVPRHLVLGRATAVALSVDPRRHYMPRWERFFSRLK